MHRPYRHPWGTAGIWISTALVTFWILLGSFEAVFPDVLEKIFGVEYGFKGSWGVTRAKFEVLTLGTLALIVAVGLAGYWFGRDVRAQQADIPLTTDAGVVGTLPA